MAAATTRIQIPTEQGDNNGGNENGDPNNTGGGDENGTGGDGSVGDGNGDGQGDGSGDGNGDGDWRSGLVAALAVVWAALGCLAVVTGLVLHGVHCCRAISSRSSIISPHLSRL